MSPNLAPGSGSGTGEGDKVAVSAYNGSRFPAVGKRERDALKEGEREGGKEGRKEGCAFRGALAKNELGEREREREKTEEQLRFGHRMRRNHQLCTSHQLCTCRKIAIVSSAVGMNAKWQLDMNLPTGNGVHGVKRT